MNFDIIYEKIFEKFTITEIVIISIITVFICGMITGYIISNDIFYHKLEYLIDNNRILLFNNSYYKIDRVNYV